MRTGDDALKRNSLQNLLYLADNTAAEYIVAAKRMKIAEKRISMWEKTERHMCLQHRCDQPIAGKKIFAHCPTHLDPSEKQWIEKDVEAQGVDVLFESVFDKAFRGSVIGDMERNIKDKEEALVSAYQISKSFWDQRRERYALLPTDLFERLRGHELQLFDTDEDWFFDKSRP
jgi:hypothetical protein